MSQTSIRTRVGRVYLKDGFLIVAYNDIAEIDVADMKETLHACRQLSDFDSAYVLVLSGKYTIHTREARQFAQQPENALPAKAEAIVVNTFIQKVIGNFYAMFTQAQFPVKLFNTQLSAETWLRQMREKPAEGLSAQAS